MIRTGSLLIAFALSLPCLADVNVAMENRMHNATGMQCMYASLETMARHHGIRQLYGLCQQYRGTAHPRQIESLLRQRGVAFDHRRPNTYKTGDLKSFIDQGRPCLIGIYGMHAVVVVGVDDESIRIISNNSPRREIQTIPYKEFCRIYDFWLFALKP